MSDNNILGKDDEGRPVRLHKGWRVCANTSCDRGEWIGDLPAQLYHTWPLLNVRTWSTEYFKNIGPSLLFLAGGCCSKTCMELLRMRAGEVPK